MSLNVQLVGTLKQVKVFKVVHMDGRTPFIKFRNLKQVCSAYINALRESILFMKTLNKILYSN